MIDVANRSVGERGVGGGSSGGGGGGVGDGGTGERRWKRQGTAGEIGKGDSEGVKEVRTRRQQENSFYVRGKRHDDEETVSMSSRDETRRDKVARDKRDAG